MTTETIEQRQANRVGVEWLARIARKGLGVISGRVRNASIGGVYLECDREFPLQMNLLMEIHAPHRGENRKILAEGTIVRAQTLPAGAVFGYGIRFHKIGDDDLHYLLAIVADLWIAAGGDRQR